MDDVKIHDTEEVIFTPATAAEYPLDTRAVGRVQICINSTETLEDDGPVASVPSLMLWGNDAELTAAEARQVAAILLDQADKLDQITQT